MGTQMITLDNITYMPDGKFRIDYSAFGASQVLVTPMSLPMGRFMDNAWGTASVYANYLLGMFTMHVYQQTGSLYKEPGAQTLFEEAVYKTMSQAASCC